MILSGIGESFFFHTTQLVKPSVKYKYDHLFLNLLRASVMGLTLFITGLENWNQVIAIWCFFPLIHDGVMYWVRDVLKPGTYPKRFWDGNEIETLIKSNAIFDFPVIERVYLCFVGIFTYFEF